MSNYDTDTLTWSEEQAALLRRVADGERLNTDAIDWANIIEEIETVGRNELHAVDSLLIQTLVHLLKAEAWPDAQAVGTWRKELRAFRRQLRRIYRPSMRQRIDLADLYAEALDTMPELINGQPPRAVRQSCPYTLEQLLEDPETALSPESRT